ncbi:MAG: NusG domain II-containing protein [Lachnospiraceae bacterium]|nr:NusG domain II-containing protein [Lachnospiraceae bacterium]
MIMKRNDLILILVILLLGIVSFIVISLRGTRGEMVNIYVDGVQIGSYPLNEDREVLIEGVGGVNTLVIKDGKADITDADCPDRLCVHQAPVDRDSASLVCLPHKVIVTVESYKESEADQIAY